MEELQDEVEILLDFLAEDESVHEELVTQLSELDKMMTSYEMTLLLSEPYDHNNAILESIQDPVVQRLKTGVICCFVCTLAMEMLKALK